MDATSGSSVKVWKKFQSRLRFLIKVFDARTISLLLFLFAQHDFVLNCPLPLLADGWRENALLRDIQNHSKKFAALRGFKKNVMCSLLSRFWIFFGESRHFPIFRRMLMQKCSQNFYTFSFVLTRKSSLSWTRKWIFGKIRKVRYNCTRAPRKI